MHFKRVHHRVKEGSSEPNTCHLIYNNWNDFGFETTSNVTIFDNDGVKFDLGFVRIMTKGMGHGSISLPQTFEKLPESYCSLGKDRDYYLKLMKLNPQLRRDYLSSLRDCVHDHKIWHKFKEEKAMKDSLLRDVQKDDVIYSFPRILRGETELTPYSFVFEFSSGRKLRKNKCAFSVEPNSKPPSNIHVLIGRNGVGKTRILNGIVEALVKRKSTSIGMKGDLFFNKKIFLNIQRSKIPDFLNLVIVSYSAFDNFNPFSQSKRTDDAIPYYYVGLKKTSDGGSLSVDKILLKNPRELNEEFNSSLSNIIQETSKFDRWKQALEILSSDPGLKNIYDEINYSESFREAYKDIRRNFSEMSSGHKIVLLTLTKLVEYVSDRSLVLIDEPETHLHPPLLGSFIRALSNLLNARNAVAIVATHSPVILQEVPKSCINILARSGEEWNIQRPDIETFAENVGALTRKVFGLEVDQSGFFKLLQDSAVDQSFEKVMKEYGNEIGSEGRALLRAFKA